MKPYMSGLGGVGDRIVGGTGGQPHERAVTAGEGMSDLLACGISVWEVGQSTAEHRRGRGPGETPGAAPDRDSLTTMRRTGVAILIACLLGIPAGVGAFTFVYAKGFSYLSTEARAYVTSPKEVGDGNRVHDGPYG